jgi:hypothetical protein
MSSLTTLARMLAAASCLYAVFSERPAPPETEHSIRLFQYGGHDGTTFSVTTLHLDPASKRLVRGQECYTSWREDKVHTTAIHKYVNVTYYADGKVHRFGAPAKYRFEFDHAPCMEQGLYWDGACLRSDRVEATFDEMHAMVRELGVEL